MGEAGSTATARSTAAYAGSITRAGSTAESTGSKIMYSIYLLLFTGLATLINTETFINILSKREIWVQYFCTELGNTTEDGNNSGPFFLLHRILGQKGPFVILLIV